LVHYQRHNYEGALEYANKIETVDVYLDPLTKVVAKAQIGLFNEMKEEVSLLNETFSEIMSHLYATLDTFLLDKTLVKEIIEGARKAGVNVG